jgi:amino acid adenylation domain-containing protein/non-ribosomal peptide synthase protein (TIGR01720 family)
MGKIDIEDMYPLSPMQQGMLFHTIASPGTDVYVVQLICNFLGALDAQVLKDSWREAISKHTVLRTAFAWERRDEPLQVVLKDVNLAWQDHELRGLSASQQQEWLVAYKEKDRNAGFNLSKAPLMRFSLIRLGEEEYQFIWTHHHMLLDGWSIALLMNEIASRYQGFVLNERRALAVPRPFRDYVDWIRQQDLSQAEAFWRRHLKNTTAPTALGLERGNRQHSDSQSEYGRVEMQIPKAATATLRAFAQRNKLTLNSLIRGAWALLLSRYSGSEDVIFGATQSGRPHVLKGVESMIGLFINTLPVPIKVDPQKRLLKWLMEIQNFQAEMSRFEYSPLQHVQRWSQIPRGTPLFESILVFENYPISKEKTGISRQLQVDGAHFVERSNYPITVIVDPGECLSVMVGYDSNRFEREVIERMLGHIQRVIESIPEYAIRPLTDIPLLNTAELDTILVEWNQTQRQYESRACVHEMFEQQAEKTPDAVAAVYEEEVLSYRGLNERANRLAHYLRSIGVGSETTLGICLRHSLRTVVGLLGIMKAGGAYVPVDPTYPPGRLDFMQSDSGMSVLLIEESTQQSFTGTCVKTISLDGDWNTIAEQSAENPTNQVGTHNLAYIIYTSGSTGLPKGVMIDHHGLSNYLNWCTRAYRMSDGQGSVVHTSLGFDLTITSLFSPLLVGGECHILPDRPGVEQLVRALSEDLTFSLIKLTPAHLDLLETLFDGEKITARVNVTVVGGEALLPETAAKWQELAPCTEIINEYGPTETVVGCCVYKADEIDMQASSVPIGRPIANTRLYVLDKQMRPTPVGVPGELHIGGAGLARGYLNRPDQTAEKFIPDPYSKDGARLYKSGDVARYLEDGNIECLGRIDNQVKIKGYRIELGEIEALLSQHNCISQAVVIARDDELRGKSLAAYLVNNDQGEVSAAELRDYMKDELPGYMVPDAFVFLERLPLTSNGKIDRHALLKFEARQSEHDKEFEAPRNAIEQILADTWQEVLRVPRIRLDDNFFELGGDSILNILVIARLKKHGLKIMPKQLYDNPTIARLAAVVTTSEMKSEPELVSGKLPLTPVQRWFFQQDSPVPQHYNQSLLLEVQRPINALYMKRVVEALVLHHDALRLRFIREGGQWMQVYGGPETNDIFAEIDISQSHPQEQQREIESISAEFQGSLDLCNGPIMRAVLFTLGSHACPRLLLIIHHLAVDGVSWRILLEDIETSYGQIERGEQVQLAAKTTSYKRWAERLEQFCSLANFQQEQTYWLAEKIKNAPRLPVDFRRPIEENIEASATTLSVSLKDDETDALLRDIPAKSHIQVVSVLLTALARSFERLTGERSLLVELEGHGREPIFEDVDLSRTVGWFTTLFPVCLTVPLSKDQRFSLKLMDENLRSVPKRGLAYGLMRYLSNDESLKQKLLAVAQPEIVFNYLGQFEQTGNESMGFRIAPESSGPTIAQTALRKALLEIECYTSAGKLQINFRYSKRFHKQSTVEHIATEYLAALRSFIECFSDKTAGYAPSDISLAELKESPDEKIDVEDIYPVSPMQQGLIFHTLSTDEAGVYFNQFRCTLEGDLDATLFKSAWEQTVERHAILRTAFIWKGMDEPMQVVARRVNLPWTEHDWRDIPHRQQAELFTDFLRKDREQGFELTKAPLIRLTVFRREERISDFVWSFHHLLLDGWSLASILREVLSIYEAERLGESVILEAPRPYRDFIEWLRDQDRAAAESYWSEALKGFTEPTPLPIDNAFIKQFAEPEERAADKEFDKRVVFLTSEASSSLQSFGRENHVTMYTMLQGAWAILLSRYGNADEVVFGSVVSGRPATLDGVDEMAGLFINTIPVRIRANCNELTTEWLYRLQSRFVESRQYEYARLVDIQQWSDLAPGISLFNTLLVYENYPVDQSLRDTGWSLKIVDVQSFEKPNYPISIIACMGDRLNISALYDPSRISEGAAERLLGHMQTVLESIPQYATRPLTGIPLLSTAELNTILVEWNQTRRQYESRVCIHEMFEQQVERTPNAVAAAYAEEEMCYAELNKKANQMAHYLRKEGVGPEVRVGICVERSVEMVIGLLGILKAGAAYVPMDPAYPRDRLKYMVEDGQVEVMLTQERLLERLPEYEGKVICLDTEWHLISTQNDVNLIPALTSDSLAYVIYTSGSTGQPKGVLVTHDNLVNSTFSRLHYYGDPVSCFLLLSSYAFDSSVAGIFWTLCAGGTLAIPTEGSHQDLFHILDLLNRHNVSHLLCLPSLYNLLLEQKELQNSATLRTAIVAGESCTKDTVERHAQLLPRTSLFNEYGPTEGTVWSSVFECEREGLGVQVPIGRPIPNVQIYLLDEQMNPMPVGVPGELHIGGAGLARGYLNKAGFTAEKFVPNPFSSVEGARLYKTGDLARYLEDGNIEWLGRIDNQVKIRGYRIELGEIEALLSQHNCISQAVVIARDDELRGKSLAAYLVNNDQDEVSTAELRDYMKDKLPDYMVPENFIFMEAMPLTHNGKLDRNALPAPGEKRPDPRDEYIEPGSPVEKLLAEIWSQVLHVDDISINRRFVEMGGNSLLAIQVVAKANDAGLPLSFAHIFQHQTIAQLASVVASAIPAQPINDQASEPYTEDMGLSFYAGDSIPSPLVPIQPNGSALPFFCVHPGVGIVNGYAQLANHLGNDQPFYGLQDPNVYGIGEPDMPLEDMAQTYISAIQSIQAEGPYLLGGWSFGGLVAFEMAVQLRARGHDIAALALFDTPSPRWSNEHSETIEDVRLLAILANAANPGNLDELIERIGLLSPEDQLNFTANYINKEGKYAQYGAQFIQRVLRIFKARLQAIRNYSPSIYRGQITLFRASEIGPDMEDEPDQTLGWSELSSQPVEINLVPGNHDVMVFEPHVEVLAARLAECITRSLLCAGKVAIPSFT